MLLIGLSAAAAGCGDSRAATLPPDLETTARAATTAGPSAAAAPPKAEPAKPPEAPTLTLSAVGDCTLGTDYRITGAQGTFHHAMEQAKNDLSVPFSGVVSVLDKDDLTIANLEGPLSHARPTVDARFVFNGKPEYAGVLAKGSVELVTVANNHAFDFGLEGAKQTVAALEEAGVGAFGNGRVDKRVIKGIEVVNIGYAGGGSGVRKRVIADVKKHKRDDNLVIVSFHWGLEGSNQPILDQQLLGRAVIDAGANLVLGHHPHVLQGIETYRGRHIVYSLGNFVFGGNSNPADKDSMIYQEVFAREGGVIVSKENRILPVRISSVTAFNDFRPVLLEGEERERVLARVKEYSDRLLPAPAGP